MFTERISTLRPSLPDNFVPDFEDFFASYLLEAIPGASRHFRDEEQVRHMANAAISIILQPASHPEVLRHQLRQLGAQHRKKGILRIQLKVGREAFLSAVAHAAPDLSESELSFFEEAYDEVASEMMAAISPTKPIGSSNDN